MGDLFLVIYTVLSSPSYRCSYQSPSYHHSYVSPSYRCSYETQGLEIALVFLGFAWSFNCVCTPRSRAPENSNIEVGDVDASAEVIEASVRSYDEINILTCGGAKNIQP